MSHALQETFVRSQLAITSIYIDFYNLMDFHIRGPGPIATFATRVLPLKTPLLDPSWLLFHRLSKISQIFTRFHGFQGPGVKRPVATFAIGVLPLMKPLLDPSWLLFHRFIESPILRFIDSSMKP